MEICGIEEAINWLEKAQVILAKQAQEESIIAGRSERNESLQYHMAIQCILEEYVKQQKRINLAKDIIEYYLMGNSTLNDFNVREKELEKLLNILNKAEEAE